jgi:hypothetical protein
MAKHIIKYVNIGKEIKIVIIIFEEIIKELFELIDPF